MNQQNITFDFLQKTFNPVIYSGFSPITNLSDQYVSYYAYLLQEYHIGISSFKIDLALENKSCLVEKHLEKIVLQLTDLTIIYKHTITENYGALLPCIELSFKVTANLITKTVLIRDGFLLKSLMDAEITDFNQLENYNAVFVFNNLNVNPELSAFIKFEKK